MIKILFTSLLLLGTYSLSIGQSLLQKYIAANIAKINTADPESSDFSDFDTLGKSIGASRVIMLGEADHSDGTTLALKSRLVKYLHEQKGFNVILFENDFYSLTQGWDSLNKDGTTIKKFLTSNLYPMWSRTVECSELLYTYVPKTFDSRQVPLQFGGFDSQLNGSYARQHLKETLKRYLLKQNIHLNYLSSGYFLPITDSLYNRSFANEAQFKSHLTQNRNNFKMFSKVAGELLGQLGNGHRADFEYQLISSLKGLAEQRLHHVKNKYVSGDIRDAQMAENLAWLLTYRYPQEKVIVWAANYHIVKNKTALMTAGFFKRNPNMCTALLDQYPELKQKTFILTTVSAEYPDDDLAAAKPKNCLNTWIEPGLAYGFINMQTFQERYPQYEEPFTMRAMGHAYQTGYWNKGMDGILYVKVNRKASYLRLPSKSSQ